jgi:hypothetical protein
MIAALEVDLYSNGLPTAGRANCRVLINVFGLFSMSLGMGELVSLPLENEDVQKLIASGALEIVDAPTQANTEVL